jgi:DNA-nicking Smr family endonuclease
MAGRRRGRFPTREELELWANVTRHDEPLERRRPAVRHEPVQEDAAAAIPAKPAGSPPKDEAASVRPAVKPNSKATNGGAGPPPHQPFDYKAAKRIARGRHEIEARLDLHGMRQSDAHAALHHFLARCQADGLKHVLIITGKGITPEPGAYRDFWTSEQRGVLRRLVPQWLSEPSMRQHVISFTESHLRHGGSGALYVTIRKDPRSKG